MKLNKLHFKQRVETHAVDLSNKDTPYTRLGCCWKVVLESRL